MKRVFYLFLVVLAFASCKNSEADLLKYASSDDAMVGMMDPSQLIENAGMKVHDGTIMITPTMKRLMRLDRDEMPTGVDLRSALYVANFSPEYHKEYVMVAVNVLSETVLTTVIEKNDYYGSTKKKISGCTVYSMGYHEWIVIKDKICFFIVNAHGYDSPVDVINAAEDAAQSAPLSGWQKDALSGDNAMCFLTNNAVIMKAVPDLKWTFAVGYDSEAVATGFCCIEGKLDGLKAKIETSVVDKDGKKLSNSMMTRKVDTGMLRYAPDNAFAAAMVAVDGDRDWYGILSQAFEAPVLQAVGISYDNSVVCYAASVLENIDGTVVVAAGSDNLSKSTTLAGWDITVAAQLKKDAGEGYIELFRSMLDQEGVPYRNIENGIVVEVPDDEIGEVTAMTDGSVMIITNAPSAATGHLKYLSESDFGDYGGLAVSIPKAHPLAMFAGVPFGAEMTITAEPDEVEMEFELIDTDGLLLENMIKFLARVQ